jgi:hypothetical protein
VVKLLLPPVPPLCTSVFGCHILRMGRHHMVSASFCNLYHSRVNDATHLSFLYAHTSSRCPLCDKANAPPHWAANGAGTLCYYNLKAGALGRESLLGEQSKRTVACPARASSPGTLSPPSARTGGRTAAAAARSLGTPTAAPSPAIHPQDSP